MRLAFLLFCITAEILAAQTGSLSLAGTVVNSHTGEPVARAQVSLMEYRTGTERSVLSEAGGSFRITGLAPGTYRIRGTKPGYSEDSEKMSGFLGFDLKVATENYRVSLKPLGSVSGTVRDESGLPLAGVSIAMLAERFEDGVRTLRNTRNVLTDDRGQYRFWNVAEGKVYLKATGEGGPNYLSGSPGGGRIEAGDSFEPAYSDGARAAEFAKAVVVGTGAQVTADFRVKLEPAWRVSGTLRNFTPGESVQFFLIVNGEEIAGSPDQFNAETGAFMLQDMTSGEYILTATQGTKSGEVRFRVNGGVVGSLELPLAPEISIPVSVRTAGQESQPANPTNILTPRAFGKDSCAVTAAKINRNGSRPQAVTKPGGRGELSDMAPGRYRIKINCFGGYVLSALWGTQDLRTNEVVEILPGAVPPPIDVLAMAGGGSLQVQSPGSQEGVKAVLLVPASAGNNGPVLQEVYGRAGDSGAVARFMNLAPGRYTVYGFGTGDVEYGNPEFLKSLSGGASVEIEDRKAHEVELKKVLP